MKFIELFAGIGGFRYGLERCVGAECADEKPEQTESEVQLGRVGTAMEEELHVLPTDIRGQRSVYRCVWANEIDKYAASIYRKNYGGGELYEGDIRKVNTEDIPDHDLLVGGFPCQAFSIAGKRAGFDDTRGTLFFEIARILKDKRPRCVLLENVKGLLSHDSGKTFQTILKVLSDIGYRVEWQVLNSKNFGVPQNRERVFIIGHLRGQSGGQIFPLGETDGSHNQEPVSTALDSNYWKGIDNHGRRTAIVCPTIRATHYKSGDNQPVVREGIKIRRLTPTECERLQGFPDGWTEGISDTQRYKCLGNAVTTNVITEIGERIAKIYKKTEPQQKEKSMSMESELGRIADSLERIEAGMAGSVVTPTPAPIMEEPKKAPTKRKSTKAKVAEPVVSPAEVNAEAKQSMSAEAFLKSCNKRLVAIKDFSLRGFIVRDLKAMFQLDYGIKSLKELPADKVDECAVKFNAILEAVR